MLNLFKNDGTPVKTFEDYLALYLYITHQENLKLFPDHPEFGTSCWNFSVLSPERIARLIQILKKEYDLALLLQARDQKLSMIEICEGDYRHIAQILVTPDVDIADLRDDWCLAYCKEHGMFATETE
jgi:hypothetical protein